MKPYEITYLIVPDLTTEEAGEYHEGVKKLIAKIKGTPGSEQTPTKRVLAYSVKKNNEAYLASLDFEAESSAVQELKKLVEKEKKIIRHLIISKKVSKRDEEDQPKKRRSLKPEKATLKEIDEKIDEIV